MEESERENYPTLAAWRWSRIQHRFIADLFIWRLPHHINRHATQANRLGTKPKKMLGKAKAAKKEAWNKAKKQKG